MNENRAFYMLSVETTGWYIKGYSRKAPISADFLSLFEISYKDMLFVENALRKNRREIFLLKSGTRSVLISTHFYFSAALLLAAVIDAPAEAFAALMDQGKLSALVKAPSCEALVVKKKISGESCERLISAVASIGFLVTGNEFLPEAKAYPLYLSMAEKAKLVEYFSESKLEVANGGVFGNVNNYDTMLCTAFILMSAAYIKRAGVERTGKLTFYSSYERLYVTLEAEVIPDTRAFEFDVLKYCADMLGVGFFVIEEKGKIYIRLCSHRPDHSKLGLKNEIYLK